MSKPKGSTLKIYIIRAQPYQVLVTPKKIPCITPIYHNDKFGSDIKEKCHLFNSHVLEQYTPLVNNSKSRTALIVHTKSISESFHFSVDYLGDIIKKLVPTKLMDMTWVEYVCWIYVGIPYVNRWKSFLKTA